jgi:23S rRNA (uracil1939-C5)-methyltransferase
MAKLRTPPSELARRSPAGERAAAGATRRLDILHVGSQGDGVAIDASGASVFVPLTLPGETVETTGAGERLELHQVLTPSPDRVVPPCPHFGVCGGCAVQHWGRAPYVDWKVELVRTALERERIETEILPPFAAAPHTRRRVALHARRIGREVVVGFKGRRSWAVEPIVTCVIADPAIVEALPALARLAAPFLEHPKSAPILHVTVTDTGLDVDVTGIEAKSGGLSFDARVRAADRAREADLARLTMAGELLYGARPPTVRFGNTSTPLPPGGFLQAVPATQAAMSAAVVAATSGAQSVGDLFCGSGTFTFPLAERSNVVAIDGSAEAIAALEAGRARGTALKSIRTEVRDLFRRPLLAMEMKKLDAVVFDPPRAGAEHQAREIAASKLGLAVAVSCNPQTFARDAAILIAGGFRLDSVLPVDQFLWSAHVELVGVFRR